MKNNHTKKQNKRRGSKFSKRTKNQNRRHIKTIDPDLLIKRSIEEEPEFFKPTKSFNEMSLDYRLKRNLESMGFVYPTQIQEETFDHLVSGRDLMGVAKTGTGKTGAFLIPIIEKSLSTNLSRSLVIVPTRELALQVEEEFNNLNGGVNLTSATCIGGTSINRDLSRLKRRHSIVIGTPGRLMDLAGREALRLDEFEVLVLDEFDRMLDMGFVTDVMKIVGSMISRKQTMLFSATLNNTQKSLIDKLLRNPIKVKVNVGAPSKDQIEQDIIRVPQGSNKFDMLLDLIDDESFEKVLVFAETKRLVDRVSKKLRQSGVRADHIHGDKSQNYRNNALNKFKRGNVQVLVATDVASRGIDVSNITHVINYQLPQTMDSYIHRIGRTGRAGNTGRAFTFVD